MRIQRLCLLFGALILPGCFRNMAQPLENAVASLEQYYPLAVGNSWTYEETLLSHTRTSTVEIIEQDQGVFVDNRGGRMRFDGLGLRDDKRYLLRKPLEPGRAWTNVVALGTIERYRILGVGVECGPFLQAATCVKVESTNRMDENTLLVNEMTFAPNVGLVLIEVFADVRGQRASQSRLVLKSFISKTLTTGDK